MRVDVQVQGADAGRAEVRHHLALVAESGAEAVLEGAEGLEGVAAGQAVSDCAWYGTETAT